MICFAVDEISDYGDIAQLEVLGCRSCRSERDFAAGVPVSYRPVAGMVALGEVVSPVTMAACGRTDDLNSLGYQH